MSVAGVTVAGGITTLDTSEALSELQTGAATGFGPYLENTGNYLPQQDGMSSWTITVDSNGNVSVTPV